MPFPIDYSGEIGCGTLPGSNVELFRLNFMRDAQQRLVRAHARVEIRGTELFFRTSPLGMFSFDGSLLANIPSGKLTLNVEEEHFCLLFGF